MSLDVSLHALRISCVFEANITHNLARMADEAGIYKALWRPEEIGIRKADQLIPLLERGLKFLESDPEKYTAFNPPNGWGTYEHLLTFTKEYLAACKENPDADVDTNR